MPKKKNMESPEDQAKRFREKVEELINAGELNPTDADAALDKLVRRSAQAGSSEPSPDSSS
jgi:polyhydroxyalkanoate synthesis regulator phasin